MPQAGQYYWAGFFLNHAYAPPTWVTIGIWTALEFKNLPIAGFFVFLAAINHSMLAWQYDLFRRYFNRVRTSSFVKHSFLLDGLIVGSIIAFGVLLYGPGNINWGVAFLLIVFWLLGSFGTLLFYNHVWPRLYELYGRQDRNVFEEEYHEEQQDGPKARRRKLTAAEVREQNRLRAWRMRDRRYVKRLERYKCSAVLPKNVLLANAAVFYFAIDARLEDSVTDIGFIDGVLVLVILTFAQIAWWYFIRDDGRLREAVYVMGEVSRLFIDIEWALILCVIPCGLLVYSALGPDGMLPWQSMLFALMVAAQIALFFLYLYPGRAPE